MQVHVVPVAWASRREALQGVRETVFIVEQQVPREIEWDGEDESAEHFLALEETGRAVGCARLLPTGQIGRMAVLAEYRGSGLGRRLLEAAIEAARARGLRRVHLHAQTHAAAFYRRAGFLPDGGEFMEAGIPHQAMTLELPIPFESEETAGRVEVRPAPAAQDPAPGSELRSLRGELDCRRGLEVGLQAPRRHLVIYSPQLDHALFDHESVVDAVSRFARSSASADVRILIRDTGLIVSRGHRLVELARRLDGHIQLRRLPEDQSGGDETFAVWDGRGYYFMPDFRDYSALADAYDPVQAERLTAGFEAMWARSTPDPELRVLRI